MLLGIERLRDRTFSTTLRKKKNNLPKIMRNQREIRRNHLDAKGTNLPSSPLHHQKKGKRMRRRKRKRRKRAKVERKMRTNFLSQLSRNCSQMTTTVLIDDVKILSPTYTDIYYHEIHPSLSISTTSVLVKIGVGQIITCYVPICP
jgi:hypothetical protein